jgi:gas vesicle protein
MSNRGGGTLLALLAGLVVGAAAGLLLAPAPGSETRGRVRRAAGRLRDELEGKAREAGDTIGHYAEDLAHAVEAGKKAYRKARERAEVESA